MLLCAVALTVLLEQNPGPGVVAENSLQVLCSGCERNLKSGTQCDMCGRWFHNSCGNVKAQMVDSRKWSCDRCKWDRLRQLEEKLENTLQRIEELHGFTSQKIKILIFTAMRISNVIPVLDFCVQ
jgi:methionyl-tRNA synthetase